MTIKRITAIVPVEFLDGFEKRLRELGVPGMTIDSVRGFGEHPNYFSSDLLKSNVRIEVYIDCERCEAVCQDICDFARETHATAGILAIQPVDCLIDLHSGKELMTAED